MPSSRRSPAWDQLPYFSLASRFRWFRYDCETCLRQWSRIQSTISWFLSTNRAWVKYQSWGLHLVLSASMFLIVFLWTPSKSAKPAWDKEDCFWGNLWTEFWGLWSENFCSGSWWKILFNGYYHLGIYWIYGWWYCIYWYYKKGNRKCNRFNWR